MRALIGLWLLGLLVILEAAFEEYLLTGEWGPVAQRLMEVTRQTRRDCISIMRHSPKRLIPRAGTLLKTHALCVWVLGWEMSMLFLKRHGCERLFRFMDVVDFWVITVIFRDTDVPPRE